MSTLFKWECLPKGPKGKAKHRAEFSEVDVVLDSFTAQIYKTPCYVDCGRTVRPSVRPTVRPSVVVSMNSVAFRLLVDTGADVSILDAAGVRAAGLVLGPAAATLTGVGGGTAPLGSARALVRLASALDCDASFVVVAALPEFFPDDPMPSGVMGRDLIQAFVIVIDLAAGFCGPGPGPAGAPLQPAGFLARLKLLIA